jgi:hypothetical protein
MFRAPNRRGLLAMSNPIHLVLPLNAGARAACRSDTKDTEGDVPRRGVMSVPPCGVRFRAAGAAASGVPKAGLDPATRSCRSGIGAGGAGHGSDSGAGGPADRHPGLTQRVRVLPALAAQRRPPSPSAGAPRALRHVERDARSSGGRLQLLGWKSAERGSAVRVTTHDLCCADAMWEGVRRVRSG